MTNHCKLSLVLSAAILYPVALLASTKVGPRKILTSSTSSCVLWEDGSLKCWGNNDNFQLGTGDDYNYGYYPNSMGSYLPTLNLGTNFKVADMCQSDGFACAANTEGKVKCWGLNVDGSLGHGNSDGPPEVFGDVLPFTDLGAGFRAIKLACGIRTACALNADGKAKCWGKNFAGELGLGDTAIRGSEPGQMGDNLPFLRSKKPIRSMGGGFGYFCHHFDDGIRCLGYGNNGVLGQQTTESYGATPGTANLDRIPPVLLEAPGVAIKVRKLTSSVYSVCALYERDHRDHIKCWGSNSNGDLGVGNTREYGAAPQSMGEYLPEVNLGGDFGKIIDVQSYWGHTCALNIQGKIKCWGLNQRGQLGLGDSISRGKLADQMGSNLPEVNLGLPAKSLSVGTFARHTCAILINNQVKCWGYGQFGQLGYEDGISRGAKAEDMGENLPFLRLN